MVGSSDGPFGTAQLFEHTAQFEPQVVMQGTGGMFVNNKNKPVALMQGSRRGFGRFPEFSF